MLAPPFTGTFLLLTLLLVGSPGKALEFCRYQRKLPVTQKTGIQAPLSLGIVHICEWAPKHVAYSGPPPSLHEAMHSGESR